MGKKKKFTYITTKFSSKCSWCYYEHPQGAVVRYYPQKKVIRCNTRCLGQPDNINWKHRANRGVTFWSG